MNNKYYDAQGMADRVYAAFLSLERIARIVDNSADHNAVLALQQIRGVLLNTWED